MHQRIAIEKVKMKKEKGMNHEIATDLPHTFATPSTRPTPRAVLTEEHVLGVTSASPLERAGATPH